MIGCFTAGASKKRDHVTANIFTCCSSNSWGSSPSKLVCCRVWGSWSTMLAFASALVDDMYNTNKTILNANNKKYNLKHQMTKSFPFFPHLLPPLLVFFQFEGLVHPFPSLCSVRTQGASPAYQGFFTTIHLLHYYVYIPIRIFEHVLHGSV